MKAPVPDASLDPFVEGAGVLSAEGEFAGHILTHLTYFRSLGDGGQAQWWVWYIVIWADGSREPPAEDYPPFLTVTEMKNGYFEFFGRKARERRYDFEWLQADEARALRAQLEITDRDF